MIIIGVNDDGKLEGLSSDDIRRLNQLISNTATNIIKNPINPGTENYFINAPVRLFIFDNRVEIISPGRLPNNLTIENIKSGNSNIRNDVIPFVPL